MKNHHNLFFGLGLGDRVVFILREIVGLLVMEWELCTTLITLFSLSA